MVNLLLPHIPDCLAPLPRGYASKTTIHGYNALAKNSIKRSFFNGIWPYNLLHLPVMYSNTSNSTNKSSAFKANSRPCDKKNKPLKTALPKP